MVPEAGCSCESLSLKLEGSFSLCTVASQRGCRGREWGGGLAAVGLESLEGSMELGKEEGMAHAHVQDGFARGG